jgi:aminopeptidase N
MKRTAAVLYFLFLSLSLFAQPLDMFVPYRSTQNKAYWKNRPPYHGYWQQDVKYAIKAKLDDSINSIGGSETITYYNNSPDVLPVVYFHLYENAFVPGSYLGELYKTNHRKIKYGPNESQGLGTVVSKIESDGKPLQTELVNTILKVYLTKPLQPGDSVSFSIDFTSYFDPQGSARRRMKMFVHSGFKHYDGVHWYPRICVYDRYMGWDLAQHLNREFYGDYGTFDAELTLPKQYIAEGTGVITNRDEVLPDTLRARLNVRNFANRTPGQPASVLIPPDGTYKTWKFHAINVFDFAWTADPTYRIGEYKYNGTTIIALAQEENAPGWQSAALFSANIVSIYGKDFGSYGYPKLVVADARDGMEYPMMTLVGGTDPGYHFVIAHEVGHQWFFGMVGNNETYRAFLDEGFTQFLSVWSLDKLTRVYDPTFPYWRENSLYGAYLKETPVPFIPSPLNTQSDHFNSALDQGGGYGQVYYKGGTMLYNLKYVLGDTAFESAMQHYVAQWKYCHPYPDDFRKSISEYTGLNLTWFFDEWYNTKKVIDYRVTKAKKASGDDMYNITFKRDKAGMEMPVRFTVYGKNGRSYQYYVPNSPDQADPQAHTLPVWIGWDKLNPTYTAQIQAPGGIKNVVIDTAHEMADINLMNNSLKFPLKVKFDKGRYHFPDRRYYNVWWRPDLWYNAVDGIKAGLHAEGNYNNAARFFSVTGWYNTGLLSWGYYKPFELLSFNASWRDLFTLSNNSADWYVKLRSLDGLRLGEAGIDKKFKNGMVLNIGLKAFMRADTEYVIYPFQWQEKKWNNTLNVGLTRMYDAWGFNGNYTFNLRSSALLSDYQYQSASAEWKINHAIKKLNFRARLFAEYITGSSIAPESQLYLAGANPEEMMENKFTRSKGFFPQDWYGYGAEMNHFQYGGGLNLRGYAGYLAPYASGNDVLYSFTGNSGAAINLEMDMNRLVNFHPPVLKKFVALDPYLFYDAGIIGKKQDSLGQSFSPVRMDAGLGLALTIKNWGRFQNAAPLTVRFDMPFFVNRPPYTDQRYWAFRWVVGVERAF